MGKIPKGGDSTVRMVTEQQTVLVEQEQLAKFLAERIGDGWRVESTKDGAGRKEGEVEVEVRLSRQYDINAPVVGNGQ